MSTHGRVPRSDDTLARAENALRHALVPEGPSQETLAQTLAALSKAADSEAVVPFQRRKFMLTILKLTAAVLAAAGGISYFAGFPPTTATAAFVEAAQQLRDAPTLSFRMTMQIDGEAAPQISQVQYKVPGLVRSEFEPRGGPMTVLDMANGKSLILDPAQKSAILLESPPSQGREPRRDNVASMIDDFRQLGNKNAEAVGEKVIGDVRARGFRVTENGQDTTVWVDPNIKLPVLIETTGHVGTTGFKGTFAEIKLGAPIDDALFSLETPQGYTLHKVSAKLSLTPEDAVVRLLRMFAENTGGTFPSRLDDLPAFKKALATNFAKKKADSAFDPQVFELSVAMARVAVFPLELKNRFGYKADGAKLGDAGTIIFWYQPEGKTKYTVVYGDLQLGDVTAEQLPEKTKP